ncbi:MAG: hypothetical protein JWO64_1905 [Hyphomicrobiales bacterium]|nr:hypothetical protein [Hyphomicrobiales bacterium]
MRALAAMACLVVSLLASRPAFAQAPTWSGHVTLHEACETVGRAGCIVRVLIEGPIMAETAHTFAALLDFEQKRAGASVKPIVTLQSTGGDVNAAMSIGREIRKHAGETFSKGPCHSACVFVAMGGVERNIAGIGLHRPYFAKFDADVLAEADARYKRMMRLVADYLFEMNISEDVLRLIASIPPDEMRLLAQPDARRIGLNGVDPAYDEMRTAREAAQYGLSSAEWRHRLTSLDRECGREADMRSREALRGREECQNKLRERVLWGFDEATFARLNLSSANRCHVMAPDSPERRACVRQIADALRHEAQLR